MDANPTIPSGLGPSLILDGRPTRYRSFDLEMTSSLKEVFEDKPRPLFEPWEPTQARLHLVTRNGEEADRLCDILRVGMTIGPRNRLRIWFPRPDSERGGIG